MTEQKVTEVKTEEQLAQEKAVQREKTKSQIAALLLKAKDGGYNIDDIMLDGEVLNSTGNPQPRHIADVFLDRNFFKCIGSVSGWGEWNVKADSIEHDFEIEYYLPDEARTPQYCCKTCFARKVGETMKIDISVDGVPEWAEIAPGNVGEVKMLKAHGGYAKDGWMQKRFYFFNFDTVKGFEAGVDWLTQQI